MFRIMWIILTRFGHCIRKFRPEGQETEKLVYKLTIMILQFNGVFTETLKGGAIPRPSNRGRLLSESFKVFRSTKSLKRYEAPVSDTRDSREGE